MIDSSLAPWGLGALVVLCITVCSILNSLLNWRRKCCHDWQLVTDKELKSKLREMAETGIVYKGTSLTEDAEEYAKIVYVAILRCTKCGDLKDFEKDNA